MVLLRPRQSQRLDLPVPGCRGAMPLVARVSGALRAPCHAASVPSEKRSLRGHRRLGAGAHRQGLYLDGFELREHRSVKNKERAAISPHRADGCGPRDVARRAHLGRRRAGACGRGVDAVPRADRLEAADERGP